MKCRSCGAELVGYRCEYCGTASENGIWMPIIKPLEIYKPSLGVHTKTASSTTISLASNYTKALEKVMKGADDGA